MNIDLGRAGNNRIELDLDKEKGIGISGYCGTGKSNLSYIVISKVLENKDFDIHIFEDKNSVMYAQFKKEYESVIEHKYKLVDILKGLKSIVKEIKQRQKSNQKQKKKLVIVDGISVINMKLDTEDNKREFRESLLYISKLGHTVGIIPLFIFIETGEFDAPKDIVENLSVLISLSLTEKGYERWNLNFEEVKRPKKVGEALIRTSSYEGFIKTYLIDTYISDREGIFNNWNPYRYASKVQTI